MFDIHFFRKYPRPFFKFAKEIYPGQFQPSTNYRFIKLKEDNNQLLRDYRLNMDTPEETCGIRNVITCYGSCTRCHCQVWRQRDQGGHIQPDHPTVSQVPPRRPGSQRGYGGHEAGRRVLRRGPLSDLYCEAVNWDKSPCDLIVLLLRDNLLLFSFSLRY
ncbi:hypothetical protein HPB48_015619 [Haemaphysalis longicornis]|uniref:Deacetylase sirtuin-type domain-containing protein n=1 Tax=Haemaphysalis longicornis TaxID=44386 RepID=A0A9J6FHR8_HAELO|nr:hypothetical protein HPB48_015619 [Haemaphysalis longicornis]